MYSETDYMTEGDESFQKRHAAGGRDNKVVTSLGGAYRSGDRRLGRPQAEGNEKCPATSEQPEKVLFQRGREEGMMGVLPES